MLGYSNPSYRPLMGATRSQRTGQFHSVRRDQLGFYLPPVADLSPTSSGPGKFETIFNGALSIGSQIISAIGKNPSTQITQSGGKVSALPTPYGSAGQVSAQPMPTPVPQLNSGSGGVGQQAGATAVNFFDGIAQSFGVSSTTMFIIGGLGIYLLLRPSPMKR